MHNASLTRRAGLAASVLSAVLAVLAASAAASAAATPALVTVRATAAATGPMAGFDGVVEAVRQSVLAAQVSGAVVQLDVKVGDRVQAGQVLLRIDARAAEQSAMASDAQVQAARAGLDVAQRDLERQRQLQGRSFISQAALDRAEAEFKATQARVNAELAQAGVARTQTGLHVVRAPYAGVVAEVSVTLGDMALPGRALVTLYDPSALRITAAVPQTAVAQRVAGSLPRAELPGLPAASQWPAATRLQVLPTVDATTHTVTLRVDLPAGAVGATPGMFARLWLPVSARPGAAAPALTVPTQAVVRRAEMTGLYVLDGARRPVLRQVRLGRVDGASVEVLSGLSAGEDLAVDPQAAARTR